MANKNITTPNKIDGSKTVSGTPTTEPTQTKTSADGKELANEIVMFISKDINARSGLGAIWRQLNASRKKEMLEKWEHSISKMLE